MSITLPENFYTMPTQARAMLDSKELRDVLRQTGGSIIACGRLYNIVTKNMGAGMYKVTLELANP